MDFSKIQIEIIRKVLFVSNIELLNQVLEVLKDVHTVEDSNENKDEKQLSDEEQHHKVTELKANDKVFRDISKLF